MKTLSWEKDATLNTAIYQLLSGDRQDYQNLNLIVNTTKPLYAFPGVIWVSPYAGVLSEDNPNPDYSTVLQDFDSGQNYILISLAIDFHPNQEPDNSGKLKAHVMPVWRGRGSAGTYLSTYGHTAVQYSHTSNDADGNPIYSTPNFSGRNQIGFEITVKQGQSQIKLYSRTGFGFPKISESVGWGQTAYGYGYKTLASLPAFNASL